MDSAQREAGLRERRLGRFVVPEHFHHGAQFGEGLNLFHGFLPLRIRHDLMAETHEFVGWHADFEVSPRGALIPEYVPVFDAGAAYPRWVRRA